MSVKAGTGGIQVQAKTLPSEDAEEGFSFIRLHRTKINVKHRPGILQVHGVSGVLGIYSLSHCVGLLRVSINMQLRTALQHQAVFKVISFPGLCGILLLPLSELR